MAAHPISNRRPPPTTPSHGPPHLSLTAHFPIAVPRRPAGPTEARPAEKSNPLSALPMKDGDALAALGWWFALAAGNGPVASSFLPGVCGWQPATEHIGCSVLAWFRFLHCSHAGIPCPHPPPTPGPPSASARPLFKTKSVAAPPTARPPPASHPPRHPFDLPLQYQSNNGQLPDSLIASHGTEQPSDPWKSSSCALSSF